MSADEAVPICLWKEKAAARAEPADFSDNLVVQLGVATEALNRSWYERNTGGTLAGVGSIRITAPAKFGYRAR